MLFPQTPKQRSADHSPWLTFSTLFEQQNRNRRTKATRSPLFQIRAILYTTEAMKRRTGVNLMSDTPPDYLE